MAFAELTGSNLYNLTAKVFFKGLGKLPHCTAAARQDRKTGKPLWSSKWQIIVQIRIMTEGGRVRIKQNRTPFLGSERDPKAAQQGVTMLHHVAEKDTNAPEMKRALKTWQGNINNTYPM